MKNYLVALKEILWDYTVLVAFLIDLIGIGLGLKGFQIPPVTYAVVLISGILISSIRMVSTKNKIIQNLKNTPKAKLRLEIENPELDKKPIITQKSNPDRLESNVLYLVIYNDGDGAASQIELRNNRPNTLEKNTLSPDGHYLERIKYQKYSDKEVFKYSQDLVIHPHSAHTIAKWEIRSFHADQADVNYELYSSNSDAIKERITIIKRTLP